MSLTDEMLIAYVDGELSAEDRATVEAAIAADPALAERIKRHGRLRDRVSDAFAGVLDEPVPERLTAAAKPSNVVSLAERRSSAVPAWAAMAAALVVGVFAGLTVPKLGPQPMIGADLTAGGDLAGALETQLASAPAQEGPVRIGLTFRSADGYCRTFSAEEVAGLACREGGDWRVRMAMTARSGGGEYRMAASQTPPEILQAAQSLMVGAPLDAEAEAKAKAGGWRP